MKIAIPVENETKKFFGNAGHTPFFAVYAMQGGGMFKSFTLVELRKNPRTDLEHHHHDHEEGHACQHDDHDEEHVRQHHVMADAVKDCSYLVVKHACKNTARSMQEAGLKLVKYNGQSHEADTILRELSAQLN